MHLSSELDSFLGGERIHEEIQKVIIQYFKESGHSEIGDLLEDRLNVHPYSAEFLAFRSAFHSKNWRAAEDLCKLLIERDGAISDSGKAIQYILQAEFYEKMLQMDYLECLRILKKLRCSMKQPNENMMKIMAFDLVVRNKDDMWHLLADKNFLKICGNTLLFFYFRIHSFAGFYSGK